MITRSSCKKPIAALLLSLCLVATPRQSPAQDRLLDFSPGALATGLGGTGVLGVHDPSALFWNPAALGEIHEPQALFAVHQPFVANMVGYAHFFPQRGTFALNIARTHPGPDAVEWLGFGWGAKLSRRISSGLLLSGLQIGREGWTAAGLGLGFHPAPDQPFWDGLSLGLSAVHIPLIVSDYDHQIRAGLSYSIRPVKTKVIFAQHIQRGRDSSHLGLIQPLHNRFRIYAGVADFDRKKTAFGTEWRWDNLLINIAYETRSKRAVLAATFRIGPHHSELADREYKKAKERLRLKDRRSALVQGRRALAFDPGHSSAADLVSHLEPILRQENVKIDSLLQAAAAFEMKKWYISAAANYLSVLKLDPYRSEAEEAISRIRPRVNIQTERWYQHARSSFYKSDYASARDIFESIMLVRPDHKESRQYLDRIQEIYSKRAEDYYYAGLGYYRQRRFREAQSQFEAALQFDPDHGDALAFLNRLQEEQSQNRTRVQQLLSDAASLAARGVLRGAQLKYQQALSLDPENETARLGAAEMERRITDVVGREISRGERAFSEGNYNEARAAYQSVLAVAPGYARARRGLEQIIDVKSEETRGYFELASNYFDNRQWEMALSVLDSAILINPDYSEAVQLRDSTIHHLNVDQLLERAKSEFLSGRYLMAMEEFNRVLQRDPNNLEARELRERCQSNLNDQVDQYFNHGLAFYTEEKYRRAIAEWDKALEINPFHKGSLEYIRRARERLDTLNHLPDQP